MIHNVVKPGSKKDHLDNPAIMIHTDEKQSFLEPKDTHFQNGPSLRLGNHDYRDDEQSNLEMNADLNTFRSL